VGGPGAAKGSACHIDESRIDPRTMSLRATTAGAGKRRRTALTRRARSPLAAFRQALLAKSTALTIGLVGQIDGQLS